MDAPTGSLDDRFLRWGRWMGSPNAPVSRSRPPPRSPTPLSWVIKGLERGGDASDAPRAVPHPPAAGDRGPGEGCCCCSIASPRAAPASEGAPGAWWASSGGLWWPCRPGEDPRGPATASWLPCTAVWGASGQRPPGDRVALWRASGRLWVNQGGPRGGAPPLHPLSRPWGGSLSAVGGVQHLTDLGLADRNRLGDPSRSSGRSRIALWWPDPPPPWGFCPPRAPAGRRRLRQESPQQRCSPPGGPFVALGDAPGAPAAVLTAYRGSSSSPSRVVDHVLVVGGGAELLENVPFSYSGLPAR